MWPVRTAASGAGVRPRVPGIVIGATRIDCGVLDGDGADLQWQVLATAPIAQSTEQAMKETLALVLAAALAGMRDEGAQPGMAGLHVLVEDRWLAVGMLPWSAALARAGSADAYARAQLLQAGFAVSVSDRIRLDDAPYGMPRLAVAYGADLLSAIEQFASGCGLRLASVLPLSAAAGVYAGRQVHPAPDALALLGEDDLVIVAMHGARARLGGQYVTELHMRSRDHALPANAELSEAWARLCLRRPAAQSVERIAVVDASGGAGAAAGLAAPFFAMPGPAGKGLAAAHLLQAGGGNRAGHVLDAMPPPRQGGRWPAVALGIAVLAVLFLGSQAGLAARAAAAARTQLASASPPDRAVATPASWTRDEAARVQAINDAIRALNLPIDAVLHSLEPPPDLRVAVLSVETTGQAKDARSALRIVAESPSSAEMARYVAFVAARKPFIGAYLMQHELIDEAGQKLFRFTVEAQWED